MLEFSSQFSFFPPPSPSLIIVTFDLYHRRWLLIMSSAQTRHRVIGLYKEVSLLVHRKDQLTELIRLGRDYPNPGYNFVPKVQAAFRASAGLTDQKAIDEKLALAEHVKNETLALISLSKYRYLRRTYCVPNKDTIPDVSLENTNR